MAKINVRAKGASGEREMCKWLDKNLGIQSERNLDQVRSGGADIITEEFVFEVKRVENLDIQGAWIQCKTACSNVNEQDGTNRTGVVCFRRNKEKWSFAISAKNIGLQYGYVILPEKVFIEWVEHIREQNVLTIVPCQHDDTKQREKPKI